eukprot:1141829-Pelagomonas_calceolata.AAC.4
MLHLKGSNALMGLTCTIKGHMQVQVACHGAVTVCTPKPTGEDRETSLLRCSKARLADALQPSWSMKLSSEPDGSSKSFPGKSI